MFTDHKLLVTHPYVCHSSYYLCNAPYSCRFYDFLIVYRTCILLAYGCVLLQYTSISKKWENVKFIATTTDSLFQAKIKNIYPKFKQDANVVVTDERLIDDITNIRIQLSTLWVEVDLVFIPLLSTNKVH